MSNSKTHWKKLENPDYLGAYSLEDGKDLTVTIEKVVRENVTGQGGKKEECTIIYLKNHKPMILNRTNMKMIQKIYDTPYIEDWVGKSITLYVAKIRAFGEDNVECLRIRNKKPVETKKTVLAPNSSKWQDAVKYLMNGGNIETIEKSYQLTTQNRELLISESL